MGGKLRSEALIDGGHVFNASHMFTGIAPGGATLFHIKTPPLDNLGRQVVLDFQAGYNTLSTLELLEEPTLSGDGTAVTPRNMNRNVPDDTDVEVYHTPGVTVAGTQILYTIIQAASVATLPSGAYDADREWVLKPDTSYLLRVTELAGIASEGALVALFRKAVVN